MTESKAAKDIKRRAAEALNRRMEHPNLPPFGGGGMFPLSDIPLELTKVAGKVGRPEGSRPVEDLFPEMDRRVLAGATPPAAARAIYAAMGLKKVERGKINYLVETWKISRNYSKIVPD